MHGAPLVVAVFSNLLGFSDSSAGGAFQKDLGDPALKLDVLEAETLLFELLEEDLWATCEVEAGPISAEG